MRQSGQGLARLNSKHAKPKTRNLNLVVNQASSFICFHLLKSLSTGLCMAPEIFARQGV